MFIIDLVPGLLLRHIARMASKPPLTREEMLTGRWLREMISEGRERAAAPPEKTFKEVMDERWKAYCRKTAEMALKGGNIRSAEAWFAYADNPNMTGADCERMAGISPQPRRKRLLGLFG